MELESLVKRYNKNQNIILADVNVLFFQFLVIKNLDLDLQTTNPANPDQH
jgi:hypothetical protein